MPGQLAGQPRLSNAAGPHQGEQSPLSTQPQVELGQLGDSPDEPGGLGDQVGGVGRELLGQALGRVGPWVFDRGGLVFGGKGTLALGVIGSEGQVGAQTLGVERVGLPLAQQPLELGRERRVAVRVELEQKLPHVGPGDGQLVAQQEVFERVPKRPRVGVPALRVERQHAQADAVERPGDL